VSINDMFASMRAPTWHRSASAKSGPPKEPPKSAPPAPPRWRRWLLPIGLLVTVLLLLLMPGIRTGPGPTSLSYTDFLARVDAGQVTAVTIDDKVTVDGKLSDGGKFTSQIPTAHGSNQLDQRLQSKG
jgi:cell division protease FtsH